MKQFYSEYTKWEDYKNGMYIVDESKDKDKLMQLAIKMLSNNELFLNTCKEVVVKWNVSTKVNLTNTSSNRKAWLGQACCNYKYSVPEIYTREAWFLITEKQRIEAKNIAEKIIKSFELN